MRSFGRSGSADPRASARARFWIPVFLLWPLLLLAWLLAGLGAAVALIVFAPRGTPRLPLVLGFWGGLARVFCELRGTRVAVEAHGSAFDLTVY